jgi:hypothetical protein
MLEIVAPENFRSVRSFQSLNIKAVGHDPRYADFEFDQVTLDLRNCSVINPRAAMWCLIYLLLARQAGMACTVRLPANNRAYSNMHTTGVAKILRDAGVALENTGPISNTSDVVLPATRYSTIFDAENTTNIALDRLVATGHSSANIFTLVTEMFAELANNAAEHSESPIGSFGLIVYLGSGKKRRLVCAVADGGIGIKNSLTRNTDHVQKAFREWSAINHATRERVSGTGDSSRGIGLSGIESDLTRFGYEADIPSGIGIFRTRRDLSRYVGRAHRLFPGTLGVLSIPV